MEKVKMELVSYTKIGKDGKEVTKKHYPKLYGKHRKEQKRTEAGERKKAWDKLTLEQKWDAIGPTGSEKHRARLMKQIKAS
jgi:hypothetical protein|tara:strand:+ start:224 stop:466 length:243 start_codon:yes stop_codon:yes gene_type:complete